MRRLVTCLAAAVCLALLGGCTSPAQPPEPGSGERVVTDMLGRQVVIPQRVDAIAATGSTARILTYAGCADRLVGVTDMDKQNNPAMPYTTVNAAAFSSLPSVGAGGSNDICYEEALVLLSPDLIFCNLPADTVDALQTKTGIPVVGLSYAGVFDDSVIEALRLVGEVMDAEAGTARVIEALQGWQQDLDSRTRDIPERDKPTVYAGAVSFQGPRGVEGSYANYPPFTAIHAKNVADETRRDGALVIDLEQLLNWNPEVLFLNPANRALIQQDYAKNKQLFGELHAVRNNRIYTQIPYNFNATNIEIAVADAYSAGKILFPQQFADVDPVAKADEIFEVMLGQPFYQRLAEAGIGFGEMRLE